MTASQTTLECTHCHKQTSKDEAEQRKFNTGFCGRCGGTLIAADAPKSFWWYDYNYRVYQDDDGKPSSRVNELLSWRELAVVGETSRSWVLANGVKIPKNKDLPHGYAEDIYQVRRKVWVSRNAYPLSEAVRKVDAATMMQIASMIGYEERKV
jgi:hypothetical protein